MDKLRIWTYPISPFNINLLFPLDLNVFSINKWPKMCLITRLYSEFGIVFLGIVKIGIAKIEIVKIEIVILGILKILINYTWKLYKQYFYKSLTSVWCLHYVLNIYNIYLFQFNSYVIFLFLYSKICVKNHATFYYFCQLYKCVSFHMT